MATWPVFHPVWQHRVSWPVLGGSWGCNMPGGDSTQLDFLARHRCKHEDSSSSFSRQLRLGSLQRAVLRSFTRPVPANGLLTNYWLPGLPGETRHSWLGLTTRWAGATDSPMLRTNTLQLEERRMRRAATKRQQPARHQEQRRFGWGPARPAWPCAKRQHPKAARAVRNSKAPCGT